MPSDFETFVDVVLVHLKLNVAGLRDCITHRLAPWTPEQNETQQNEHHLAVWVAPEAEIAVPLTTNAKELRQLFNLLYWESAGDESSRGVLNEETASALFTLQNETRDSLHAITQVQLGGGRFDYLSTAVPDRSGQTLRFAMQFSISKPSVDFY